MKYTITVRKVGSDTMTVEADSPELALEKAIRGEYEEVSDNGTEYTRDDASGLGYVDGEQTFTEIYDEDGNEYDYNEVSKYLDD